MKIKIILHHLFQKYVYIFEIYYLLENQFLLQKNKQ